jgi:hypothetical protein
LGGGGAGADAFRDRSQVMDFVAVPVTMSRWAQRLQCAAPPKPVLERPGGPRDLPRQPAVGRIGGGQSERRWATR